MPSAEPEVGPTRKRTGASLTTREPCWRNVTFEVSRYAGCRPFEPPPGGESAFSSISTDPRLEKFPDCGLYSASPVRRTRLVEYNPQSGNFSSRGAVEIELKKFPDNGFYSARPLRQTSVP